MKKTILPLLFAIALAVTSCSQYTLVNSETYNNADLSAYHTFRIVEPDSVHRLPPTMTMMVYYNIAAAIREQMVERGFEESPTSDMLINIGLTVKQEIATEPALPPGYFPYSGPFYNGYGPYWMWPRNYYWQRYYANAQVITGIYKEGVLSMDIINIAEKLPLYSASVATILDNGSGQFRNLQGIAQAVETLFSKFPVPLLPQYRNRR